MNSQGLKVTKKEWLGPTDEDWSDIITVNDQQREMVWTHSG